MKSKTHSEILAQYDALTQTYDLLHAQRDAFRLFFQDTAPKQIVVIGSGSSFHLSSAVAMSANFLTGIPATAIPAGDIMLHTDEYSSLFADQTLLITLSRSGSTHEILIAMEQIKLRFNQLKVLSFICSEDSILSKNSDYTVEMPWAFDESVCQTRSVTNLYGAAQLALGIAANNEKLIQDVNFFVSKGNAYLRELEDTLSQIGKETWNNAVVLCDGEGFGVAEEAALAFNEIAYTPSICKHVLDVRHGPIVLINSDSLVIAKLNNDDFSYQKDLVRDLVKKGAVVVVVSDEVIPKLEGVRAQIAFGKKLDPAVTALILLPVAQILSYYKALAINVNPDQPDGLDAWIAL